MCSNIFFSVKNVCLYIKVLIYNLKSSYKFSLTKPISLKYQWKRTKNWVTLVPRRCIKCAYKLKIYRLFLFTYTLTFSFLYIYYYYFYFYVLKTVWNSFTKTYSVQRSLLSYYGVRVMLFFLIYRIFTLPVVHNNQNMMLCDHEIDNSFVVIRMGSI